MKRSRLLLDPRFLLCLTLPLLLAFAPHDGIGGPKDIGNSAPPGIGGDGPWSRLNMELLSRLTLSEIGSGGLANVTGNDCWGWTDSVDGKEYAICGLTNATSFIDISDPYNPIYLGRLPTQTGNAAWRDMKVFANHVFVVSDGNGDHGMQVFDLNLLRTADRETPTTFSNTTWYDQDIGSAHNIAINSETGFAYIVGSDQASGGLHVVDVNDPANPIHVGDFSDDGYTHDVQVVSYSGPDADYAGREIAFACNEDTVTIVDVTDKNSMTMVSRNLYAEDEYTHQGWLSEDHRYFYMGDELDESRLGGKSRTHIFDCEDLDSPVYMGYFSHSTGSIDHNLYIKDGYIYCGNYSSGLRVLDASDPLNPTEVAYFDTYNTDTGVNFNGVWSVYPFFESNTVLINDRQNGMFLVRLRPVGFIYPEGRPDYINSKGGVEFTVEAASLFGEPEPGTGVLHVDRGNGFEEFPMNEIATNVYEANFPPTPCGTEVRYFVSVEAMDGTMVCDPENDPAGAFSAFSLDSQVESFSDNFESDMGWTVTGDATDGEWQRGVPAGGGNRADPPTDADGSGNCYVTDNADGNSDVDGGSTLLTSPTMNAVGPFSVDAVLSYHRWYSNDFGNAAGEDLMLVEISNDDGDTWVTLEEVGPTGNETSGEWFEKQFRISDFLTPTDQMRVRFTASDLGDGSVVEAGVDGLVITLLNCAQTVLLDEFVVDSGEISGGTIDDLTDSDNERVSLISPPKISTTNMATVTATSPTHNPTMLEFMIEAQVGRTRLTAKQRVEFFDFVAGAFEKIDVQSASIGSDSSLTIEADGDLSRFVEPGTAQIKARITHVRDRGRTRLRLKSKFDRIVWRIVE